MNTVIGFIIVILALLEAIYLGSIAARNSRNFDESKHVSFAKYGNGINGNGKK